MSSKVVFVRPLPAQPTNDPTLPGLPRKLRDAIWELALPGPRVVYVERKTLIGPHNEGELEPFGLRSPSTINLLYVCHESREIALKHYEKVFATKDMAAMTWFNFDIDTLYLDWGFTKATREERDAAAFAPGHFLDEDSERVKTLALYDHEDINYSLDTDDIDYNGWFAMVMMDFDGLEDVVMVQPYHDWTDKDLKDLILMTRMVDIPGGIKKYREAMSKPFRGEMVSELGDADDEVLDTITLRIQIGEDDWNTFLVALRDWYHVPEISFKTITTNSSLEEYDRLAREYAMKEMRMKFLEESDVEAEHDRLARKHAREEMLRKLQEEIDIEADYATGAKLEFIISIWVSQRSQMA